MKINLSLHSVTIEVQTSRVWNLRVWLGTRIMCLGGWVLGVGSVTFVSE